MAAQLLPHGVARNYQCGIDLYPGAEQRVHGCLPPVYVCVLGMDHMHEKDSMGTLRDPVQWITWKGPGASAGRVGHLSSRFLEAVEEWIRDVVWRQGALGGSSN